MPHGYELPEFNARGVLPPGLHRTRLDEFRTKLGFNPERLDMIECGLELVLAELKAHKVRQVFVGGSFVTERSLPGDIDMYVVVPDRESSLFWFVGHRSHIWQTIYRVQCFPALKRITGPGSEAYWRRWFGHEADGSPKGIVLLNL